MEEMVVVDGKWKQDNDERGQVEVSVTLWRKGQRLSKQSKQMMSCYARRGTDGTHRESEGEREREEEGEGETDGQGQGQGQGQSNGTQRQVRVRRIRKRRRRNAKE